MIINYQKVKERYGSYSRIINSFFELFDKLYNLRVRELITEKSLIEMFSSIGVEYRIFEYNSKLLKFSEPIDNENDIYDVSIWFDKTFICELYYYIEKNWSTGENEYNLICMKFKNNNYPTDSCLTKYHELYDRINSEMFSLMMKIVDDNTSMGVLDIIDGNEVLYTLYYGRNGSYNIEFFINKIIKNAYVLVDLFKDEIYSENNRKSIFDFIGLTTNSNIIKVSLNNNICISGDLENMKLLFNGLYLRDLEDPVYNRNALLLRYIIGYNNFLDNFVKFIKLCIKRFSFELLNYIPTVDDVDIKLKVINDDRTIKVYVTNNHDLFYEFDKTEYYKDIQIS